MKSLKTTILEKLVVGKPIKKQTIKINKDMDLSDFYNIVQAEIEKYGEDCDLNHIDVSEVEEFTEIFCDSNFDGDISKWDMSSAKWLDSMFYGSSFTGKNSDISNWKLSNVISMRGMFKGSAFDANIDKWKINPSCDMDYAFSDSDMVDHLPKWFKGKI